MKAIRWIFVTVLLSGLVLPLVANYLDRRCGGSGACVDGLAHWVAHATYTPDVAPHSAFDFWSGIVLAGAIGAGGYLLLRRIADWDDYWPYFRATQFTLAAVAIIAVVHLATPWLTIGDRTIEDWLTLVFGAVVVCTVPIGYLVDRHRERVELRERVTLEAIRSTGWDRGYQQSEQSAAGRVRPRASRVDQRDDHL